MNWSKDELLAYLLLYAAHSNFKEDNHERNVIISKVDMNTFQKIHDEFDQDNDYQSLQKLQEALKAHQYTSNDIDMLMNEVKNLFYADGDFDVLEQNMMHYLKRIIA